MKNQAFLRFFLKQVMDLEQNSSSNSVEQIASVEM